MLSPLPHSSRAFAQPDEAPGLQSIFLVVISWVFRHQSFPILSPLTRLGCFDRLAAASRTFILFLVPVPPTFRSLFFEATEHVGYI